MGMERLLLIAELSGARSPRPSRWTSTSLPGGSGPFRGLCPGGYPAAGGIKTEFDHVGRSFKAQFKFADKLGARYVAILGEDELRQGCVKLKDMAAGTETLLPMEGLEAAIRDGRVNQ